MVRLLINSFRYLLNIRYVWGIVWGVGDIRWLFVDMKDWVDVEGFFFCYKYRNVRLDLIR